MNIIKIISSNLIVYSLFILAGLFFFNIPFAEARCEWIGSQANYMKCQCWNGSWGYGTSERNALNQCPSQPSPPPAPSATLKVRNTTDGTGWTTSNITIDYSDQIALNWSSSNASSCSGSYFSASGKSGTQTSVSEPSAGGSKTYKITCTGSGGTASDSLTVTRRNNLPSATLRVRNTTTGSSWTTSNLTIGYADQAALNWSSTNASSCSGSNFSASGTGGTQNSVSEPGYGASRTYTITCTGPGGSRSDSLVITRSNPPVPTVTLKVSNTTTGSSWTASNLTINTGEQVSLNWATSDATSCSASGSGFSASGTSGTDTSIEEPPAGSTYTYTVTCSGPGGNKSDSLQVTTRPLPTATLEAQNTTTGSSWSGSNLSINPTEQVALRWSSTNSSSCSGSNFSTGGTTSGTVTSVSEPSAGNSKTFSVVCSGNGSQDSDSLTVTVNAGTGADINTDQSIVHSGDSVELSWNVGTSDPATCEIRIGNDIISGYTALSTATGSFNYTVDAESNFILDCESGGNTDDVTVTVLPEFMET